MIFNVRSLLKINALFHILDSIKSVFLLLLKDKFKHSESKVYLKYTYKLNISLYTCSSKIYSMCLFQILIMSSIYIHK